MLHGESLRLLVLLMHVDHEIEIWFYIYEVIGAIHEASLLDR